MAGAWRQVEEWLDLPAVWIPQATERHRHTLASLLGGGSVGHKLVADAHLAALAIQHGSQPRRIESDPPGSSGRALPGAGTRRPGREGELRGSQLHESRCAA